MDGDNLGTVTQTLTELGYVAVTVTLKSSLFFSPQRRVRVYIVAYLVPGGSLDVGDSIKKVPDLVKRFEFASEGLDDFILDDDHAYVKSDFDRRMHNRSADQAPGKALGGGASWKNKYTEILQSKGQAVSSCVVPKAARSSVWFNTLTPRCQMVLGHALNNNQSCFFVDCYQSLQREFVSSSKTECSTIVPGSVLWSTALARPLLGPELLKIQGLPDSVVERAISEKISDHSMTDLAGNSFTGFVFAAAAIAALVHAPAWTQSSSLLDSVASIFDL